MHDLLDLWSTWVFSDALNKLDDLIADVEWDYPRLVEHLNHLRSDRDRVAECINVFDTAIETLNRKDQKYLRLKYVEQLSREAISNELGVTENTVYRISTRCIKRLRCMITYEVNRDNPYQPRVMLAAKGDVQKKQGRRKRRGKS